MGKAGVVGVVGGRGRTSQEDSKRLVVGGKAGVVDGEVRRVTNAS